MTAKFDRDGLNLTRDLLGFVRGAVVRETDTQRALREETALLPMARMMISPEQGCLMALLARMLRAKRIVEVGTFTGYSATWLSDALEPGGVLIACDKDPETTAIARRHWEAAGLGDKIVSRVGLAAESLQGLLDEGWAGTVDMIFIDADKTGYPLYRELGLKLLRSGGLLLFDNALWSGSVADASDQSDDTVALRKLSEDAGDDDRFHAAMMTIGDGLLAVLKP